MPSLSEYNQYYRLPLRSDNDHILIDYQYPKNQAGAGYYVNEADARVLARGINIGSSNLTLDAEGFATLTTGGYNNFFDVQSGNNGGMPPHAGRGRVYEAYGKTAASMTTGRGVRFFHNMNTGADGWLSYLMYDASTLRIWGASYIGASWVQLYTQISVSGSVGLPAAWVFRFIDWGDTLTWNASAYETDTTGDAGEAGTRYNTLNRTHKAVTDFMFQGENAPSGEWFVRGLRVWDMP